MKDLTYDRLLALPEDEIKETFPHGGRMLPNGRWLPAESEREAIGQRTLKELLADKKRRAEKPRLLHRHPSAVGEEAHVDADEELGYTHVPHLSMSPDAGEAPPVPVMENYGNDATARFRVHRGEEQARDDWRSLMGRLREMGNLWIKKGHDPAPLFRAVESMLADFEDQQKAA